MFNCCSVVIRLFPGILPDQIPHTPSPASTPFVLAIPLISEQDTGADQTAWRPTALIMSLKISEWRGKREYQ